MNKIDKFMMRLSGDYPLHKIGLRLTNRAKLNALVQRIVDHGVLVNSIRYRVEDKTLTVGVGAKYAKFHEFGTKPSAKMARWIFANLMKNGKKRASKNVIQWTGRGRNIQANIKARPFFWPAIDSERKYIYETLRTFYLGKK